VRAFVAIVDAGGFARAGARLHLSQPALSRQIRAFEAELAKRAPPLPRPTEPSDPERTRP